jgi:outer membrane receptor for ferrienterochelin and colicins
MSRKLGRAAVAIVLASAGLDAHAQSMDYGALERLFGEPVTTSATGSPQRASDVPITMEIVTAEQIRRSGAYDVPGVLRHVLGVDFQQWTNDQAEIGVRGYDQALSQRVLVLVDGRQVYADYFGFTPWFTLPVELDAIRQIEVVMGPSSALFGFNAVGGVINIITYGPLDDDVNAVSLSGGTQDLAQGSVVTTIRGANAGLRISGGASTDEDFSTPLPAVLNNADRTTEKRRSIDLVGEMRLTPRTKLRVEASSTRTHSNQFIPTYSSEFVRASSDSVLAQLSSDTALGLAKATTYVNWLDSDGTPGIGPGSLAITNRVAVTQLEDVFKIGTQHALRAALEYRDDSAGTFPITGARIFYHVASVSGMWAWKITPSLSVTNAGRFDELRLGRDGIIPANYPFDDADWNRIIHAVSFNSGVVWKPDTMDTLRLTGSRGVLLPNLVTLGALVIVTPQIGVTGSPAVNPSVVTNYEASWNRSIESLAAQLSVRVFYQETTAATVLLGAPTLVDGIPYAISRNVGPSRATGVELGIDGSLAEHWRWGLNGRLESVKDRFDSTAAGGTAFVDYQHVTPTGLLNANLGWAYGKWEADAYLQYQTHTSGLVSVVPVFLSRLVPVPAYVATDARVGYQMNERTTLSVSGQNLTHSSQRQNSGPEVERRIFAMLTIRF